MESQEMHIHLGCHVDMIMASMTSITTYILVIFGKYRLGENK